MDEGESKKEVLIREGFVDEDGEMSIRGDLGQWSNGWGHSGSGRFADIYEKIQQISQWK